ncbi:IclR family transcriptional regulator [Arthrobacter sp. TB 26]|uniref:IclR family transcriptional regulator n=1 Tax=Arthrobacter sp. TB 26 TaxID=494420 RepID=UPI000422BF87|nr:IclR family transcriptional regulator [Arthrobacter sp. TB 26]
MAGGSRDPGRGVTSKVFAILEVFEKSDGALTMAEIASQSGLPVSTTHRLVQDIVEWGMLERTSTGRYQVGIRLWELAQKAGRQLREAARPWIQDLFALTGETVLITVRQERDSLVVDRAHGAKRAARTSRVGSRLPLHSTAMGKVLLAYEEEWVRQSYLQGPLAQLTPATHTNPQRLIEELAQICEQGYALSIEEVRQGACAIAVPVFHTGRIGASLGIVTDAKNAPHLKRYLPALLGTSAQIERATRRIPLETLLGAAR